MDEWSGGDDDSDGKVTVRDWRGGSVWLDGTGVDLISQNMNDCKTVQGLFDPHLPEIL